MKIFTSPRRAYGSGYLAGAVHITIAAMLNKIFYNFLPPIFSILFTAATIVISYLITKHLCNRYPEQDAKERKRHGKSTEAYHVAWSHDDSNGTTTEHRSFTYPDGGVPFTYPTSGIWTIGPDGPQNYNSVDKRPPETEK